MSNLSQFFGNSAKEVNVWADGATETRQYQVGPRNSFPFIPKTSGHSGNFGISDISRPIGPGKVGGTPPQGGGLHHFAGLWMHASAATASGVANIYTSPDGAVWTARTSNFPDNKNHQNYKFVSNGSIVLCLGYAGGTGNEYYVRQTDGITWTSQYTPGGSSVNAYADMVYLSDGYFYHLYYAGVSRSTTGLTGSWTAVTVPTGYVLKFWKIGSYYYCNTNNSSVLKTFYSTDLSNWTSISMLDGMCIADYSQVGQKHIITCAMAMYGPIDGGGNVTPELKYEFVVSTDGTPASWSRKLQFSAYDIDNNACAAVSNTSSFSMMLTPAGSIGNQLYNSTSQRIYPSGGVGINSFAVYKNRLVQIFTVSANQQYANAGSVFQVIKTKIYVITTVNGESMKIYGPVTSGFFNSTYNGISGIATSSDSSQLGIASYSFGLAIADDNAKELVINA